MTVSTQWLKTWIKAKQICKVLRAARLFEPDRNEEKWTNEHVYWEQRMSNFFINEPITFEWKHKASCRENRQTSDLSGNFVIYDWLVLILNSPHLSLRFDPLRMLHGTVFCLDMVGDQMSKYSRDCLVEYLVFFGLFFLFFFDRNDPVRVVPQKTIIIQIVVP